MNEYENAVHLNLSVIILKSLGTRFLNAWIRFTFAGAATPFKALIFQPSVEPGTFRSFDVSFQDGLLMSKLITTFWQESHKAGNPWSSVTFRIVADGATCLEDFRYDDMEVVRVFDVDKQWRAKYFSKLKFVPGAET